jgi:hypothetical protein
MGMTDFDKYLIFTNTQAEYSQKLVTYMGKHPNGNFIAKAKNAFASSFAFAPALA